MDWVFTNNRNVFLRERIIVHIRWHLCNLKNNYLGKVRLPIGIQKSTTIFERIIHSNIGTFKDWLAMFAQKRCPCWCYNLLEVLTFMAYFSWLSEPLCLRYRLCKVSYFYRILFFLTVSAKIFS